MLGGGGDVWVWAELGIASKSAVNAPQTAPMFSH